MRLDLRLKADTPWLELICSIDWRQTHEVLRLDLPLATPAVRIAADTSGGVIERPAEPVTAREQARWEVPVISWFASQSAAPGGGMAVLLDGPQGVDWSSRTGWVFRCSAVQPGLIPVLIRGGIASVWPLCLFQMAHGAMPVCRKRPLPSASLGGVPPLTAELRQWFPPLPLSNSRRWRWSTIRMPACLKLLNAGSTRCRWTPGAGWSVRREADSSAAAAVVINPGELVSLVVDQSS